jgi:hypothetical protein
MSKHISLKELRRLINKIRNISYRYNVILQLATSPDLYKGAGGSSYKINERLPKYFCGGDYTYYSNQDSNWLSENKYQQLPDGFVQSSAKFSHPSQANESALKYTAITRTAMNKANGDKVSINIGGSVKFPNDTYRLVYVGGGSIQFANDGRTNDNSASCQIVYSNGGTTSTINFNVGKGSSASDVIKKYSGKASGKFVLNGATGGTIQVYFEDSEYSDNSVNDGGPIYELQRVDDNSSNGEVLKFEQVVSVDSRINSGIYIPYYVSPYQRVNIRYLSGTWRSDYNNSYVNPDIQGQIGKFEPFKPCVVSIPGRDKEAIYNTSGSTNANGDSDNGNFIASDYGFINFRMADHDTQREDNDGEALYRIRVYSTLKQSASINTYITCRGVKFYAPIQVQDTESIISGLYPQEIIDGKNPTSPNINNEDRNNVSVNIDESGMISGDLLWDGTNGVHPKQANMYAIKSQDFLYLNNLLYALAKKVELIKDFDFDELINDLEEGKKIQQKQYDSMLSVADKILKILDDKESWFNDSDICAHSCQISCQTGCLVGCQSCNNGQCHDQKCGMH